MIITKIKAGLGNQLFQYATSRHLSLKENKDLLLDLTYYDNESKKDIFRLNHYKIEVNRANGLIINHVKHKSKYSFKKKKFNIFRTNSPKIINEKILNRFYSGDLSLSEHIYLDGWFANPNYFSEIREIIINEFEPKNLSEETLIWKQRIEKINSVSIHLRRGDYIDNTYFHNISKDYYFKSIEYFNSRLSNPIFFIFSDDMGYAKQIFKSIKNVTYMTINNKKQSYFSTFKDVEDLYLMTKCKHNIIANSTFSWWGAWLNQNTEKTVIAPRIWYDNNKAQKEYEKGDIIPSSWIKF